MDLKQYLKKNKISSFDFAKSIGYSRQMLSFYLCGTHEASDRMIRLIDMQTKGEVTSKDMKEYTVKKRRQKEKIEITKNRLANLEIAVKKNCCDGCKSKLHEMALIDSVS